MSELRVTLHGMELPFAQLVTLSKLGSELGEYTWHRNDCECCLTVHRKGEQHAGYVIGPDGGYDWYELRGASDPQQQDHEHAEDDRVDE